MPLVVKDRKKGDGPEHSPHLSLTDMHSQGGAANKRNISLLMKSDIDISSSQKLILSNLLGGSVEKQSNINKAELIESSLKEKFNNGNVYVVNYDDTNVLYVLDEDLYVSEYDMEDEIPNISDDMTGVSRIITYIPSTGKVKVKKSFANQEDIDSGVLKLIKEAVSNEKLLEVFKNKYEGKLMEENVQDIIKSLNEELNKAKSEKDEAVNALNELKKSVAEQKLNSRMEAISGCVSDKEQAVALHKAIGSLEDEAFDAVINVIKSKNEAVEESELTVQVSKSASESEEETDILEDILRKRYSK